MCRCGCESRAAHDLYWEQVTTRPARPGRAVLIDAAMFRDDDLTVARRLRDLTDAMDGFVIEEAS